MAAKVTGPGVPEMKALGARLKTAEPELKKNLRGQFRDVAGPLARAAQQSILSMPSHHDGTLRGELARTVTTSTRITVNGIQVSVVSLGSRMPPGKQNLNGYTDSDKGWKHPVFGQSLPELAAVTARRILGKGAGRGHGRGWTWVRQIGKPGWFEGTIGDAAGRDARNACYDAMAETARHLS